MKIGGVFQNLQKKLSGIDFSQIIDGFHRFPFAVYDGKNVLLDANDREFDSFNSSDGILQKVWDNRFLGNTAIEVDGNFLAIWDFRTCTKDLDIDVLTSKIVHEMFHCFQKEYGEKRWANESIGLVYPLSAENLSLKVHEYKYLLKAFHSNNPEAVSEFLSLRKLRYSNLGDFIDYESAIETYEGMAVFAELKALNQLVDHDIIDLIKKTIPAKITKPDFLINHRIPGYYSGLLIALLLDRYVENWQAQFFSGSRYLYKILETDFEVSQTKQEVEIVKEAETAVEDRKRKIEKTFDEFLTQKTFSCKKKIHLIGFDPMNALCLNKMVFHKYFAKFKSEDKEFFIEGPVITRFNKSVFEVEEIISQREINQ